MNIFGSKLELIAYFSYWECFIPLPLTKFSSAFSWIHASGYVEFSKDKFLLSFIRMFYKCCHEMYQKKKNYF